MAGVGIVPSRSVLPAAAAVAAAMAAVVVVVSAVVRRRPGGVGEDACRSSRYGLPIARLRGWKAAQTALQALEGGGGVRTVGRPLRGCLCGAMLPPLLCPPGSVRFPPLGIGSMLATQQRGLLGEWRATRAIWSD